MIRFEMRGDRGDVDPGLRRGPPVGVASADEFHKKANTARKPTARWAGKRLSARYLQSTVARESAGLKPVRNVHDGRWPGPAGAGRDHHVEKATMTLWTIQSVAAWQTLQRERVLALMHPLIFLCF